jgi:drug/metabolite transporter (DMT)-like permease
MTVVSAGQGWRSRGVAAALGAAALFGAGTPFAKLLLGSVNPWLLAGLLYLGSGAGLGLMRLIRRATPVRLARGEWRWLAGAILVGGVAGPVLLMYGLSGMPASGASLLLNAEGVFTALLAWFAFRENFDRRIALGMAAIVAGAAVLAWPGEASFGAAWPALAVLGACFAWALDNNLTRKVSLADATWIAACKGWAAGVVNLMIAATMTDRWPPVGTLLAAGCVGWLSYGVSLALFVVGLRHLGTARTGAYFSVAPFVGALIAMPLLGEPITPRLLLAGGLMALGVWLHLTERHEHEHTHEAVEHEHEHVHDAHHQHAHEVPVAPDMRHSHRHRHDPLTHAHPHFPDAHHRHTH